MFRRRSGLHSRDLILFTAAVVACWSVPACSGGGSTAVVIPPGLSAAFVESGTSAVPNLVRLTGQSSGTNLALEARVSGPTSSSDLYSFAFDLVLSDATTVELVSGSASYGTALAPLGTEHVQVIATQNANRITIGVSKVGATNGNGIASGDAAVVRLMLRPLGPGSTTVHLAGSPPHDPAALDSTGQAIPTIQFDSQVARIVVN